MHFLNFAFSGYKRQIEWCYGTTRKLLQQSEPIDVVFVYKSPRLRISEHTSL
jgi:hypothetical protein